MFIIPYIVLVGVAALFFVVCLFMVGLPVKGGKKAPLPDLDHTMEIPRVRKPKKEAPKKEAPKKLDADATQIIPRAELKKAADEEKTRVFAKEEIAPSAPAQPKHAAKGPFPEEPAPVVLDAKPGTDTLEEYFVRHFLNRYGAVSRTVEQDTRKVTHYLIENLQMNQKEAVDTLTHIMVQEALQNAQRTYVMMPTPVVLSMVSDAFSDVAHGNRSDTKTILAYDALKAMPRMEESAFRALALLLIFHYSRNTDNYDAAHLKRYADKYVKPFLASLPNEYSGYQQLEYLHCISLNNKEIAFGQVLHDSYPLTFAFRGALRNEIEALCPAWPAGSLVGSLYDSYVKPGAVDEAALGNLLDDMGVTDGNIRSTVLALLESRPVTYDRKEMSFVLGKISPDLVKLQDAWDESMLRRSSLTLMGMYIAKICIRETIGEDFDLSHWM